MKVRIINIVLLRSIPWAVRLSGLENTYSRPLSSAGDFDSNCYN